MNEHVLPRFDGSSQQTPVAGIGALHTEHGNLPLAALGYHSTIQGLTVKTEITQTFYNPFDEAIEARYIFPLEGTLAVTDCMMIVGERIIRADLQERSAARRRYKKAIRDGYRAALLEENRSETFSLAVGNIPPGEAIRIRLVTVGQLPVVDSTWILRLPLVVAPRYTSGWPLPRTSSGTGTHMDTTTVPDASHVSPPSLLPESVPKSVPASLPGYESPVQLSLSVDVDLEALTPSLRWHEHLKSSLHSVVLTEDKHRARVHIHPSEKVDRDFILRGSIAGEQLTTNASLVPPTENCRGTFAINLVPPVKSDSPKSGRNVIFVFDRSASMNGWKFTAAQRGISRLIDTLTEQDRFGLIAFAGRPDVFKSTDGAALMKAHDQNRFTAIKWLNRLDLGGGTEMEKAIDAALEVAASDPQCTTKSSIVLVTDGQITAEDAVMARLNRIDPTRRPRIYTLGVDRAVNASVLRRLSTATGGTFELVESETQLDVSLKTLGQEIGAPVLSNLRLMVDEECETVLGSTDLYANRPITIYGRTARHDLSVQLTATDACGNAWQRDVRVQANGHAASDALVNLWGKGRVRMLEDQYAIGGVDDPEARAAIVATSLESHVLSRFTAYIAVDESEVVNQTGEVTKVTQPVEFPEGWANTRWAAIPAEHRIRPYARPLEIEDRSGFSNTIFDSADGSKFNWPEVQRKQVGDKLVKQGVMSQEQWDDVLQQESDAKSKAKLNSLSLAIDQGYVTESEIAQAAAWLAKVPFVDLSTADIPEAVFDLMPETVARENLVLPIGEEDRTLVIATSNPWDINTVEKLRFILNRDVKLVSATADSIKLAINRCYGQIEGESADSMLQEFTDTQIDFTESVDDGEEFESRDFMLQEFTDTSINFTETADDGLNLMPIDFNDQHYDDDDGDFIRFASSIDDLEGGQEGIASSKRASVGGRNQNSSKVPKPIERLAKMIIQESLQLCATKIALRLREDCIQVEYLIDDTWRERDRLPRRSWSVIVKELRRRSEEAGWKVTFIAQEKIEIEISQ